MVSRLTEEHTNLLGEERLNHLIGNLEEKNKAFSTEVTLRAGVSLPSLLLLAADVGAFRTSKPHCSQPSDGGAPTSTINAAPAKDWI